VFAIALEFALVAFGRGGVLLLAKKRRETAGARVRQTARDVDSNDAGDGNGIAARADAAAVALVAIERAHPLTRSQRAASTQPASSKQSGE